VETDATTRTKGLTILARILAASLVRRHSQHCETSDVPNSPVDPSERDDNDPDANNEVGD
jgi:hypothetical protein